jgi:hypothetical protein
MAMRTRELTKERALQQRIRTRQYLSVQKSLMTLLIRVFTNTAGIHFRESRKPAVCAGALFPKELATENGCDFG